MHASLVIQRIKRLADRCMAPTVAGSQRIKAANNTSGEALKSRSIPHQLDQAIKHHDSLIVQCQWDAQLGEARGLLWSNNQLHQFRWDANSPAPRTRALLSVTPSTPVRLLDAKGERAEQSRNNLMRLPQIHAEAEP